MEQRTKIREISSHISHDLKSAMQAMSMISSGLTKNLEEEERLLIYALKKLGDLHTCGMESVRDKLKTNTHELIQTFEDTANDLKILYPDVLFLIELPKPIQRRLRYNHRIEKWSRVFSNLLLNSCEALENQKDKQINLAVSMTEGSMILSVNDNGKGMCPEQVKAYGQSLKSTKRCAEGIGTKLIKKTCLEEKVNLHIESSPSCGTTISMTFPMP